MTVMVNVSGQVHMASKQRNRNKGPFSSCSSPSRLVLIAQSKRKKKGSWQSLKSNKGGELHCARRGEERWTNTIQELEEEEEEGNKKDTVKQKDPIAYYTAE